LTQERAAQLAEHEESLDAWKRQFKEQAMQQIGDRKRALADWQARLEAHDGDVADRRAGFEVVPTLHGAAVWNGRSVQPLRQQCNPLLDGRRP